MLSTPCCPCQHSLKSRSHHYTVSLDKASAAYTLHIITLTTFDRSVSLHQPYSRQSCRGDFIFLARLQPRQWQATPQYDGYRSLAQAPFESFFTGSFDKDGEPRITGHRVAIFSLLLLEAIPNTYHSNATSGGGFRYPVPCSGGKVTRSSSGREMED